MWAIIKKEIKTYFLSPIGYIFIGLFLFVASIYFALYIYNMRNSRILNFILLYNTRTFTIYNCNSHNGNVYTKNK